MSNHPNRSACHPARNPSPAEVRAAREAAGLTQAQAAALVHASMRNWQQWEQGEGASSARRMHPAIWELFWWKAGLPSSIGQEERGMIAAQTTKGGNAMRYTLNDSDCRRILAAIAGSDADPIYATEQALEFFRACRESHPEWWRLAGNPDLVSAIGATADVFLGWRK